MNPLRTLALLGTLLAPELALAHGNGNGNGNAYGYGYGHPSNAARVEIANQFDGEVAVYLDGRYSGLVPGVSRLVLET
jgi:hypothetical protein